VPIRVHDLATVELGGAPRVGIAARDDIPEIVEGIVLLRPGADVSAALRGIHERIASIRENRLLPPGIEIVPLYDREELTTSTLRTVLEDLGGGLLLVGIVLVLLLGNVRAALVTAVNVPLALLIAFIAMAATGTPASLVIAGALDFGIIAASSVVLTESIVTRARREGRRLTSRAHPRRERIRRAAALLLDAHHARPFSCRSSCSGHERGSRR